MSTQVIAMLVVGGTSWVLAATWAGCLRIFAQRQADKMREKYYETLIMKDIGWFDCRTTASMAAELNDGCEKMQATFGDKLGNGIMGFSGFFCAIGLGFYLGWKMALVILGAVPIMAFGMVIVGQAMQDVANETQTWYAQAAAVVEESLFALRTVVAFGNERRELDRYAHSVKEARKNAVRTYFMTSFGMSYIEGVWALANAGAMFYGMTLIYHGEVNGSTGKLWTGGDVLIVFFSVLTGGFSIGQVEPAFKVMNEGRVGAAKFFEALATISEIQCVGNDARQAVSSIESFEFKDVHFCYPARPEITVLKGLNLTIQKGQKVAFVGESGSGKSTVMSLLERFYDPSQGTVLVNGQDMRTVSPSSVRALIGYVGQEPVLFSTSIRKNIMYGNPAATEADLDKVLQLAQVNFVEALPQKLDTFVGSGGSQFSGGQKQRIAIARAMLRKPQVLFLDEATSALDNVSERMIQETLDNIGSIQGQSLTTVAIAHRLTTIKHCDVIFALQDGVVAESGNHAQLMEAKGVYYALAASQEQAFAIETTNEDGSLERNDTQASGGGKTDTKVAQTQAAETKTQEEIKIEVPKGFKVPYGRLAQLCKAEWVFFLPGILGALVHGANNPCQAYLIVNILTAFYYPPEQMWEEVQWTAIQFAILGGVVFFATYAHMLSFGIISEAITQRLRVAMLTAIFRQEIGYHDDPQHTPALMGTALTLWAYRIRAFCGGIEAQCAVLSSMLIGLIIAFIGCWQMTLAMLGAVPVLAISTSIQMVFMMGGTSLSNEKIKIAQQIVSDSVQNARTVHALGMEKSLVNHHASLVAEASKGFVRNALLGGLAFGFALAAPTLVMAGGFYYSDYLVKVGATDFKGVMLAFMGVLYAAMGAGQASAMAGDGEKARQACYFIFELLDRKSLVDGLDPVGKKPSWVGSADSKALAGQITFQDVKFSYPFRPDVTVLNGVNFTVKAGQSVGLVGPSGGGKSTIMSLLQRFYDPSGGQILIGYPEMALSDVDIRWWRKNVGFVGQEPILFDTTVKANVLYGLDEAAGETISDERLEECKVMAHLDFLDNATNSGWSTEVGPRGSRLSGGQKQRVAICRALVRDPPVLLLEATSALDTESERVVQQALEAAREGRTSFSIAHRLSTIQDCDVIIVVAEGTVVETGSHSELLEKKGVYAKLQATSK
eukprot:TRINITY_DN64573_c0_g1_i2.p1 TRINITY_DN64573_c0_g1~~TRINITY_DN64573_c0_g1_i2.p1  ORF type:complete len:1276 (+),score=263.78 TRINITY_DN64573_c0_g1_i2:301-3828(+)